MIKFLKEPFLQTEGYFGQEILILGVLKINDDIFIYVEYEKKFHIYKLIENEAIDVMGLSHISFEEEELNIIMEIVNG